MATVIISFLKDIGKTLLKLIRSLLLNVIVLGLIFFLLFILITAVIPQSQTGLGYFKEQVVRNEGGEAKIAVIPLSGLILSDNATDLLSAGSEIISPTKVRNALLQAQADPMTKAVIFDLNSPGGSPVASDRIFEEVVNFKRQTKIPVVFLLGDLAASGGYYIASSADFIVANPATLTGSIGVILESYNLQGLYEKIGIAKETFKQGEYKDMLSDSRPITEEEQAIINTLNENTFDLFISRVAEGRNLPEAEIRNLATGQVYTGKQAKDLKLVDSLGNLDEAVYQAKTLAGLDRFQVVEYQSGSFLQELFGQVKTSFLPQLSLRSFLILSPTISQKF
ncbi:signal peptide peptidase SppA [Candidatus Beckwithbacteria bacterium]|nr:signal peptide peptidase SppA [Candidatus Beckwithbacteria bacterium]